MSRKFFASKFGRSAQPFLVILPILFFSFLPITAKAQIGGAVTGGVNIGGATTVSGVLSYSLLNPYPTGSPVTISGNINPAYNFLVMWYVLDCPLATTLQESNFEACSAYRHQIAPANAFTANLGVLAPGDHKIFFAGISQGAIYQGTPRTFTVANPPSSPPPTTTTIGANPPTIDSFTVSPSSGISVGDTATISWSTSNAAYCVLNAYADYELVYNSNVGSSIAIAQRPTSGTVSMKLLGTFFNPIQTRFINFWIMCNNTVNFQLVQVKKIVSVPFLQAPTVTVQADTQSILTAPQSCTSAANACGQTNTGTVINGSCSASIPANPAGYDTVCTSAANACGQRNSGTIGCNGSCNVSTPANPPTYGSSCTSAPNACGQTNSGTTGCNGSCTAAKPSDASCPVTPLAVVSCTSAANACGQTNTGTVINGSCSASIPANPAGYGAACTSSPNACGQRSTGTIGCNSLCSARTPATPASYGTACTSSPNACGQTNSGTIKCNGSCSARRPSNASCPASTPTASTAATAAPTAAQSCISAANACGSTSTGTVVHGVCNADVPATPAGYGAACTSSPNACGMTDVGTISCNGSCSAVEPSDLECPIVTLVNISQSCTSAPNACGQTNSGTMDEGVCDAETPDVPAGYGAACTSSPNACGQISTGAIQCNGSCSAQKPSDTSCASPEITSVSAISLQKTLPTPAFSASPSSIRYNGASTLLWSVASATSCTASGAWSGTKTRSGTFSTGNLTDDQTYTLTCTGANGYQFTKSITVAVAERARSSIEVQLTANPSSVSPGGSTILSWNATSPATSCTATGDWNGIFLPTSGLHQFGNITSTKVFTLSCMGGGQSAKVSLKVPVSTQTATKPPKSTDASTPPTPETPRAPSASETNNRANETTTTPSIFTDMRVGSEGNNVLILQKILNSDPATQIADSGPGSPGNEITYFGPRTRFAVIKFQEKYRDEILVPNGRTKGTGYIGSSTIQKLEALKAELGL